MGSNPGRLALGCVIAALALTACATPADDDELVASEEAAAVAPNSKDPADAHATTATRIVLTNLKRLDSTSDDPLSHRFVIGQQEADVSNRATSGMQVVASDVEKLAGRAPGLVSYELSHVDKGALTMFDAAAFRRGRPALRERILAQHKRGALVSLVWHLRCPKTAPGPDTFRSADCPSDYRLEELLEHKSDGKRGAHFKEWRAMLDELTELLFSIKDDNGRLVPVLIRPFHEFNGDWFWWGRGNNDPATYAAAYREMVSYLREGRGLHNVLWVFCPNAPSGTGTFTSSYPGDSYVDVVAFDSYDYGARTLLGESVFSLSFATDLRTIGAFARMHGKVAAVGEIGTELNRKDFDDLTWFTRKMLEPLRGRNFAYATLWRNAPWEKYVPEPGDGALAEDFGLMSRDRAVMFAGERNLYTPLRFGGPS